jgi:maltokinase
VIDLDLVPDLLCQRLPLHLAGQRWSGAHDRPVESVVFRWHEVVYAEDDVTLVWGLVDATHADNGEVATFQLFVGLRPDGPDLPDFLQGKQRELIGVLGRGRNATMAYDALVDPDLAIAVLHLVAPDVHVEVRRPLVLEHSNSSVVFDEAVILKLFRRVEPGPNPDVEITRVLAVAGSPHVLPPLAELRRDDTDLAVLREFLVGATEGWELGRTSMRDLLASRLPPEECGGDLAPDMERLGTAIGELHVAMAAAWDDEPGDVAAWVVQMQDQLARVVSGSGAGAHLVDIDTGAVRDEYDRLAGLSDVGAQIRIHGDLHLAQVIRVDAGWRVLDFEGEPARRRDDRFTHSSPLRDVAGILRSLHYAAATGLSEWGDPDDELVELAGAWEARNRDAFLAGYLAVEDLAPLLPVEVEARTQVLRAFELDKAVYELGYELSYRPEQAAIPAVGIARLVDGGVVT